ncbi:hypothetical protein L3Q67_00890 [Saccharothrix sp. AJ9571]|nr:hypothetical protein L3Q67_00890 [Saccharothrix sp. AJ9571]
MSAPATEPQPFRRRPDEPPAVFVARLWHTCRWCGTVDADLVYVLLHQRRCAQRAEPEQPDVPEQERTEHTEPFPPPPPWFQAPPGPARGSYSGALP